VQNKDERAVFDESLSAAHGRSLSSRAMAHRHSYDAEDVVQDAALRAFRGIKSFGAVNARAVVPDNCT